MGKIELRAFAFLYSEFRKRGLTSPMEMEIPDEGITGREIIKQLGIPEDKVEAVFVNGVSNNLNYLIKPNDRVGLVSPGLPSIYRVHLGFYSLDKRENRRTDNN